jgi:hypothetical protein
MMAHQHPFNPLPLTICEFVPSHDSPAKRNSAPVGDRSHSLATTSQFLLYIE